MQKTKMKAVSWTTPSVIVQRDAILKDIQHHSPTVPKYSLAKCYTFPENPKAKAGAATTEVGAPIVFSLSKR